MSSIFWALLAVCSWGVAPLLDKGGVIKGSPTTVLFIHSLTVTAIIVGGQLFRRSSNQALIESASALDRWTIAAVFGSAIIGSLIGDFAYLKALDGPATSKVVAITSAYPLITVLSSWLILSEKISLSGISGIVLVFVGVILLADGGSKSSTERAVNVHLQATSSAVHGEVVLQKTSAHSREDLPQIVSYKEAA